MKILGLGMPELVIILIVVLLIFGPKNLPKLGKAIGGGIKNLRSGMKEGTEEMNAEAAEATVDEVEEVVEEAAEPPKKKVVVKTVKKEEPEPVE